jgi:rhodanese-related sulfurtransferase
MKSRVGSVTLAACTALVVALLGTACGGDTAAARVESVPAPAAAEILSADPDAILLDIRTPDEFAGSHLDDAVNIDFLAPGFEEQISTLDRDLPYVIYCASGNRSGSALDLFRQLEFTDVVDIEGGIASWIEAGLPVVP